MNYEKTIKNIRTRMHGYLEYHKIKSVVLGVSGGMDSCLCAVLARPVCDSLGIPLIGRSLPIVTNKEDEINRATYTGEIFCTEFRQENLGEIYNHLSLINPDPGIGYNSGENIKQWKIRNGNIKARLRMILLYNLASQTNGLVMSTDNYTEYLLGFWTLHGDVGDLAPIQQLYKSEVYDIAEWIAYNEDWWEYPVGKKIILDTIDALATDGLGVTDLGDLGQILPNWKGSSRDGYKEVDRILKIWEGISELDSESINLINEMRDHSIIQRHLKTEFKRNNPVIFERNSIIE